MSVRALTLLLTLAGCADPDEITDKDSVPVDETDTPDAPSDCLNFDAIEVCNGIDDDCDGQVDEGVFLVFYRDNDGDLYGQDGASVQACTAPDGFVQEPGDCVDYNAAIFPGAIEVCNGADDDCNGVADDGLDPLTIFPDLDGDGFAPVSARAQTACNVPLGFTQEVDADGDGVADWDCNDSNTLAFPGATEQCNGADDDCDAAIDEIDLDGDGWLGCRLADVPDCDDADPGVHPTATELCDTLDQDCDGQIDEGLLTRFYRDNDGDRFGQDAAFVDACVAPSGHVATPGDCVDFNQMIFPGAPEQCNDVDDDCDGTVDEEVATFTLFPDADSDGVPAADTPIYTCLLQPGLAPSVDIDADDEPDWDCDDNNPGVEPGGVERCNGEDDDCDGLIDEVDLDGDGWSGCPTALQRDCDDSDRGVGPGQPETCDGVDNNCNGVTDEGVLQTWYRDNDGDGYGQDAATQSACVVPPGFVARGGDCVDFNAAISPDAPEVCNGADDDCSGIADDGLPQLALYPDLDGDGFPLEVGVARNSCGLLDGYAVARDADGDGTDDWDCDDSSTIAFPGALERCNGDDDDCDTVIDEVDADGDGFSACFTAANRDCDDAVATIHPGAMELCDGIDQDCDNVADDGALADWYRDNDGDGYGQDGAVRASCTAPAGFVGQGGDCVDFNPAISPAAPELCNDADDDCNGVVDDGLPALDLYPDNDGDGYPPYTENVQNDCRVPVGFTLAVDLDGDGELDWDCADFDANASPAGVERCNAVDDDCDGDLDEIDLDDDGYFGCPTVVNQDCNDRVASIYPAAPEVCDGVDQSCDGQVDEGVLSTWYRDNDADGYGQDGGSVQACAAPTGFAAQAGDCIDFNRAVNPGAAETCNDADDDCNGFVDDGLTLLTIYPDVDGDGFAAGAIGARQKCDVPFNFAPATDADGDGDDDWDCDDSNTLAWPGAPEICGNDVDESCSGTPDRLCFELCEGEWPYIPPQSLDSPSAITMVDLDGGASEIIVQDDFNFAILDADGVPHYEYGTTGFNYSRSRVVLADIDQYDTFNSNRQTLEVLTGNGSYPRFYKLQPDGSVTEYASNEYMYDASRFMARDIDLDGRVEFVTSTWCEADGTEIFRFDRATGAITKVAGVPDPDRVCQYNDGRLLTDLDGDGDVELVIGNGYAQSYTPNVWSGKIYAYTFTDLAALTTAPYCTGCFPTGQAGYYGGGVYELYRIGNELRSSVLNFTENLPNVFNPSAWAYWKYDLSGVPTADAPTTRNIVWTATMDNDKDGVPEDNYDVAYLGLADVNGDGYPDRVTHAGRDLRLDLWDARRRGFTTYAPSNLTVAADPVFVHAIGDRDDDGRLDVLSGDGSGRIWCHTMGEGTWNRDTVIPPHFSHAYRTFQWDNWEPNEGGDTNGDGVPDQLVRVPSAMTADGDFYGWLTSSTDRDYYMIDAGYNGEICVNAPTNVPFSMVVYAVADRWNNATRSGSADGLPDGQLWSDTSAATRKCFRGAVVAPPRYGEYRFIVGIEANGDPSPYWPYWITAPK